MVTTAAALLIVTLMAAQQGTAAAGAGEGQPPTTGSATVDPDALPVDLDRIQRAISRRPAIKLDTNRTVFRVEVFGRMPTIEDILGPDYLRGPAPSGGGMTHGEFLSMVTPKDVQGYAAFTNKQAAAVAATSFALQWALRQAIQKYKDAKQERAREAARQEVEEALAALRRARREAGLPDG